MYLSYNYLKRRLFLFGKSESVWPSYSAVRCIIMCSGSLKCFSNIVWRPSMVSRMTADYCVVSIVSCVILSIIMHYFALFRGEAFRCFQKCRVLRRRGFVACVVSCKSAVSIFGVEEHRCVRNVYETNHAALLPKRQSFSQMVLRNSDLTCILRLTKKRQIEPVESIYEIWQKAVLYVTLFICGLFNAAISSLVLVVSNGRTHSE